MNLQRKHELLAFGFGNTLVMDTKIR